RLLVGERPARVLRHAIRALVGLAERVRAEAGVVRVEAADRLDVVLRPRAEPRLAPAMGRCVAHPPAATYWAPCSPQMPSFRSDLVERPRSTAIRIRSPTPLWSSVSNGLRSSTPSLR